MQVWQVTRYQYIGKHNNNAYVSIQHAQLDYCFPDQLSRDVKYNDNKTSCNNLSI
jgi:hypothetical protein